MIHCRDSCTSTFIEGPFIPAKLWNKPRCPRTQEQRLQVQHTFIKGLFNHKKEKVMSVEGKQMHHKIILLSDLRPSQKDNGGMFSLTCVVSRFCRDTQNPIYIYDMKVKLKLCRETKGNNGRKWRWGDMSNIKNNTHRRTHTHSHTHTRPHP